MEDSHKRGLIGCLAILFYLIHAGVLILARESYHIIWSCHLGCLLVGTSLILKSSWTFSVGFFWLTLGVPLWVLNILTRREFMLTSTLTHLVGLLLAILGLRFLGIKKHSWFIATMGLIILGVISRLVTPEKANVNLSFSVWSGWEDIFPSHFWYVVMLLSIAAIYFTLLEGILRKWTKPRYPDVELESEQDQ